MCVRHIWGVFEINIFDGRCEHGTTSNNKAQCLCICSLLWITTKFLPFPFCCQVLMESPYYTLVRRSNKTTSILKIPTTCTKRNLNQHFYICVTLPDVVCDRLFFFCCCLYGCRTKTLWLLDDDVVVVVKLRTCIWETDCWQSCCLLLFAWYVNTMIKQERGKSNRFRDFFRQYTVK